MPQFTLRRAFRGSVSSGSKSANQHTITKSKLHHQVPGQPRPVLSTLSVASAIPRGPLEAIPFVATTSDAIVPDAAQPVGGVRSTAVEVHPTDLVPIWDVPAAPYPAPRKRRSRRKRRAPAHAASVASHEISLSDDPSTPPTSPRHPPTTPTSVLASHHRPLNARPPTFLLTPLLLLLSLTIITVHLPRLLSIPHLPVPPLAAPFPNPLGPLLSLSSTLNPSPTPPPSTSSPYPTPPQNFLDAPVRVAAIVPRSAPSPFQDTPWGDVISHLSSRLSWTDPSYSLHVIHEDQLTAPGPNRDSASIALRSAQIVLGADLHDPAAASFLQSFFLAKGRATGGGGEADWGPQRGPALRQTIYFLDSDPGLMKMRRLGGEEWVEGGVSGPLEQLLPWRRAARERKQEVVSIMEDLWHRRSSEDMLFAFLVLIHEYVTPVPVVASTANGMDLQSLFCIARYCASNVMECVNDPTCKKSLDCLQSCAFNDQVCQYRCIVSYETPALGKFSLCILQLHNCRRLSATPPALPDPAPMPSFQGAPITHEAAEKVLRGWLGERPVSWLVAAGKNPAYDYFPCQHQLFFPGKAKGAHWYEPVFKVKTLDNGEVWRRRRYRVRRGKAPGTFHFTVLDNGVTSNEFWRLLDAADDMSFALFYYSGAASAAGLSYSGAVLGTPDGRWPTPEYLPRIKAALDRAGIKMWELSNVDNSACEGAPLELSDEAVQGLAHAAAAQ